jgi:alpha-1,4-digalacturonate transport system substrate-binding protein
MSFTFSSPLRVFSRRTRVAALATVAAAGLLLAGCAGGGSGSGEAPKKLTFWVSLSAAQQAGYDQLAADYKKATGISVDIVNIPYAGYPTKLRDAAQANALPDVASVPAIDPLWSNKLVDLKSIVDDKANNINQNFIAIPDSGKVLSIPSDVTASGLFINESLFKQAGVDFPTSPDKTWTWTDFIAAADQVREKTGAKYDLTFDASPSRLRAMVYEMGGQYMHAGDDGKFATDDASQKAVQYFVGLNDDVTMPKSVWTSGADASALFQSGQVVAYWSGVWQVSAFATSITQFDWASVPTPAQPVQASDVNSGGNLIAFNNNDAEGKAAKDFLTWVYNPTQYKKLSEVNGYLPVESDLDLKYPFTSEAAQSAFALYNQELPLYDPISGYFNKAQTKWVLDGKALTTDPSVTEIGKAINGEQSVSDALKNIVDGYNQQVGK